MCKVLATAGVKPDKSDSLWKFIMAVSPFLSQFDNDGVGYAASSPNGLFGERWLHPAAAFKYRKEYTKVDIDIKTKFGKAVELEGGPAYNKFGVMSIGNTQAVVLHARMATCGKGIENTHPFVSGDGKFALIHNGVIRNTTQLKNITSSCDSECILNTYTDNKVGSDPTNIQSVADDLAGYYACAVLGTDKDGVRYLDLFRDNSGATLYCTYVKQLDTLVFCTKADIVAAALKELKWKCGQFFTVQAGHLIRLNAITGESMFEPIEFDTKGKSSYSSWNNYQGGGYNSSRTFHERTTAPLLETKPENVTKVGGKEVDQEDLEDGFYYRGDT